MAATLYNAQDQGDLKLVMVTSAAPGEGKTLTATNMALILSESFRRRVLLIDADLRRPSLHKTWGIDTNRGLSDVLKPTSEQKAQVFQVSETLTLLPAGRPDPDPIGGLTSSRMREILDDARTRFDWVILDSPPIGAVDDATLLGSMVDAVLFVVRARKTRAAMVRQAIESVGRDKIFGVVLNGTEESDSPGYGYYNYGDSSGA
jgi:capsular exopolysaccharide synthesis family protein